MIRQLLFAILMAAFALPAFASPLDESQVIKGKEKLEPAMGYITLFGTGRQGGTFIRVPDAEDIGAYQTARDEAFAEAIKKHEKQLKRWESDSALARQNKSKPPEKPVEPDRESFSIGDIERRTAVQFGPDFAYSKANGRFSYAMSVKPGTYIWYGPVIYDPKQGFIGLCYCMGSVKFEVKAGVITNLGNYLFAAPLAEKQKTAPLLDIRHNGGMNGFKVEVPIASSPVSFELPNSLANWPSAKTEFSASGKLNNFYGLMISRLPPVPGILAYERDRIVDLTIADKRTASTQ